MPRNAKAASHESRRDAATRNLRETSTPELELPDIRAEHLDLTLGDGVNVSHPLGGWGEKAALRRHMRVLGIKISPKGQGLGVSLLDIRGGRLNVGCHFSCNFEDAGSLGSGMGVILPHNGYSFVGAARSWVEDPRGGPVIRAIDGPAPAPYYISATQAGLRSERRGKQLVLRSSFGIAALGAHTGAGTTTDDTSSIFDNNVNALIGLFKRVILTAGNPHGSDGVQAWPASRAAAGSGFLTLSLYHHDDAGATLNWKLQRASDSNWWNEGTRGWQAGTVNNALPAVMTTPGLQVASRAIPSSATTYTLSLLQPSGGTVSRVNRIHHVQLEEKRFESSAMPLDSSSSDNCPGFRDDDNLQVCNDVGARVCLKERGTMLTRFVPRWSTADVDGMKMYVFAVEHDANNSVALYYDGVNSTKNRFVLEVKAGGATTTIAAVYAVTRYTEVRLGMRWASATFNELEAEYGTPAAGKAWYDLWAAAALLATGTEATMPTETNASRLQVMCRDGENIDGFVEDFTILKTVLNAAEMAAAL